MAETGLPGVAANPGELAMEQFNSGEWVKAIVDCAEGMGMPLLTDIVRHHSSA